MTGRVLAVAAGSAAGVRRPGRPGPGPGSRPARRGRELAAAGARVLQVDEPFLAGYPEQVGLAIEAVNIVTDVPGVSWVLHVCYGNRYARPLWEGHYDFLFPAVKEARIDQLALEFARRGDDELVLLERYDWDRGLGLGVIDVRSEQVETAELVAARIRRGLRYVPPERLSVNPRLRPAPAHRRRGQGKAGRPGGRRRSGPVRAELTGAAYLAQRRGRDLANPDDLEASMLFPTSLVGSYPQPDWLIDRARLAGRFPPRVRATELWRVAPEFLARPSATPPGWPSTTRRTRAWTSSPTARSAGRATPTPSPPRWTAWTSTTPARRWTAAGTPTRCRGSPGRSGAGSRSRSADVQYLRGQTDRTIKITVPGPFTMSQQAQNDYYPSAEAAALGYAEAVNAEVADLFAAGADIVQLDEPYLQARPEAARQYGIKALNRALEGVTGTTAVHLCFGYAAIIHDRPSGYSFLPELAACTADQISIETAQSGLDCAVLERTARQDDHPGRAGPGRPGRGDRRSGRRAGAKRAGVRARRAHRAGPGLRHEVPAPRVGRWASCGR